MRRGVSLSTLRRYIKAKKIQFRIEAGRYLIFDDEAARWAFPVAPRPAAETSAAGEQRSAQPDARGGASLEGEKARLERELKQARQEIAELKMLVALYEEQLAGPRLGA